MQPNKNSRYEFDRQASDEEEKKPNTNEEEKEKESLEDKKIIVMEQQDNKEELNRCQSEMKSPQQVYQFIKSQNESNQLTLTIQKVVSDLSKLFASLVTKSRESSRLAPTSVAVKQKPSRARQQQSLEELKFKSSDSIGKGLCTSLKLKTSSKKSIKQLTQDLSIFYYNRVSPTQIGTQNTQYLKKVQQDTHKTHSSLINVMKLFFDSKNVNDRVYFMRKNETILFGTEQNEKFGLIVCDSWRNSKCWAEQAVHLIPFELETNGPYNKKFGGIVKNKAVFHFFNLCINSLMKKDAKYQMIVNYPVVGCTQIHPIVKYQQHDDDEKYEKQAVIQGYMFAEHIEKIKQKLGSENVLIQTNCYKYSDSFQKSIRDALSESISDYQDYQDSQDNQIRQDTQESQDSQEERFDNENENQKQGLLKKIRRQMVNELMRQNVCERQRQKIPIDYDEFFQKD